MIILITGVNQGLGKFLVHGIKSTIAETMIIGIDILENDKLNPQVKESLHSYYQADLSAIEPTLSILEEIINDHPNIDVVINNAGHKVFKNFNDFSARLILDTYNINTLVPILINHYFLSEQTKIKLINISSNAGFKGYKGGSIYCSTKGSLIQFTEAVIAELNSVQHVYTLCPSTIITEEFLNEHKNINKKKYIKPQQILDIILKIITHEVKSGVIPIIFFKQKVKYILSNFLKFFYA